ncbi:hypothetical protein OAP18_01305 [Gammaproteobacteria bacterium]|nr:hypothetical protein [Gammaproteobacteria bacterium]
MYNSKKTILREHYIEKYIPLGISLIITLVICILIFFISLRKYEVVGEATETIVGEVVFYSRGGHKAAANPYFRVRLENGAIIKVRNYGELPFNYRGEIVINIGPGIITGLPKYSINKEKTDEAHNKVLNSQTLPAGMPLSGTR